MADLWEFQYRFWKWVTYAPEHQTLLNQALANGETSCLIQHQWFKSGQAQETTYVVDFQRLHQRSTSNNCTRDIRGYLPNDYGLEFSVEEYRRQMALTDQQGTGNQSGQAEIIFLPIPPVGGAVNHAGDQPVEANPPYVGVTDPPGLDTAVPTVQPDDAIPSGTNAVQSAGIGVVTPHVPKRPPKAGPTQPNQGAVVMNASQGRNSIDYLLNDSCACQGNDEQDAPNDEQATHDTAMVAVLPRAPTGWWGLIGAGIGGLIGAGFRRAIPFNTQPPRYETPPDTPRLTTDANASHDLADSRYTVYTSRSNLGPPPRTQTHPWNHHIHGLGPPGTRWGESPIRRELETSKWEGTHESMNFRAQLGP